MGWSHSIVSIHLSHLWKVSPIMTNFPELTLILTQSLFLLRRFINMLKCVKGHLSDWFDFANSTFRLLTIASGLWKSSISFDNISHYNNDKKKKNKKKNNNKNNNNNTKKKKLNDWNIINDLRDERLQGVEICRGQTGDVRMHKRKSKDYVRKNCLLTTVGRAYMYVVEFCTYLTHSYNHDQSIGTNQSINIHPSTHQSTSSCQ